MKLEMRIGQKLEQKIDQKLNMEQRLKLSLAIKSCIEDVRDGSFGPPKDIIKKIVERLKAISGEEHAQLIDYIFCSDKVYDFFSKKGSAMFDLERNIRELSIEYLYDTQKDDNGKLRLEDGDGIGSAVDVSLDNLRKAFYNPDALEKEIEALDNFIKTSGEKNITGTIAERNRLLHSLTIADSLREHLPDIDIMLQFVLKKEFTDGDSLSSFLGESYLLNKVDFIASDRMLNRFSNAFTSRSFKDTKPEHYKTAFSNTVGEFSLISMGIIDPNIFVLQKAEFSQSAKDELREQMRGDNIDFDDVMKRLGFTQGKQFFWHRFKTLDQKPTQITDNLIRDFITKTVRADIDQIYKAVDFENFFYKMQGDYCDLEVGESGGKNDKLQEKKDFFTRKCADLFASEEMENIIIKLIKDKWMKEMKMFYQ